MTEDYEINENGVVLNPEVIIKEDDKARVEIEYAHLDNGWVYGYRLSILTGDMFGSCTPCTERKVFPSRMQAQLDALRNMRECATRNRVINYCSTLLYQMEDDARQLTLF